MNPDRLLEHFHRIADSSDAVPRLRKLILDLAVRGKLVPQDPKDEPASECLSRLGLISTFSDTDGDNPADNPVPTSWSRVRFDDIAVISGGVTLGRKLCDKKTVSLPYLRVANVKRGEIDLGIMKEVTIAENEIERYSLHKNDLLMTEGGDWDKVGRAAIWKGELPICLHQNHVFRARMRSSEISPAWLERYFNSPVGRSYFELASKQTTNLASINMRQVRSCPVPFPPIAEQHRILAKVNELMALCDRLEAAQQERESRRDRFAAASLARLTPPSTASNDTTENPATEFRTSARFVLDNLPRITTRPEHIPQLRQTILNLAVRGKLVPQDPNDEPASELLKRIEVERRSQIETGNAKLAKNKNPRNDEAVGFVLPASWAWTSLGEITLSLRYGTSVKCSRDPSGVAVLRIPNVKDGKVTVDDLKYGNLTDVEIKELQLMTGDILLVRSNGSLDLVGRSALVESHVEGFCFAGYLVRARISQMLIHSPYVVKALSTSHVRDQIEKPIRSTVGLKNVNATELSSLILPLPPLAEQRRIVTKVEELMALCDRLEAQLTTTQTESRRLLEAILHEALAPAAK